MKQPTCTRGREDFESYIEPVTLLPLIKAELHPFGSAPILYKYGTWVSAMSVFIAL